MKNAASVITFETKLFKIKDWTILHLPEDASAKLPSRGITMVKGTINDIPFKTLLEPDGRYLNERKPSHWFAPSEKLLKEAHASAGDSVKVMLEPTDEWIDPELPDDMKNILDKNPKANELFHDITPMARWDWLRWVRAVKTEETRKKHLEIMIDKLNKGMRRPCCFNRSLCSEPYVSNNWKLVEPEN